MEIVAMLGARITVRTAGLPPGLARRLLRAFTHRNAQHEKLKRMGFNAFKEPREICTAWDHTTQGYIQLPRGGYRRFLAICREAGLSVRWDDKRVKLPPAGLRMGTLQVRENQEPGPIALRKAQQGVLRGGTGTGKTETLLAAIVEVNQPALVIVWNKDLLQQWVERIVKYGILKEREIGIFGQGRKRFGPITVGMQQTLVNHLSRDLAARFGTVALDEAHRAPAQTFGEVVNYFPSFYRWGATADEVRQDGKEFITYDTFGEVVYEIPSAETTFDPNWVIVPTRYRDDQYEEDKRFTDLISRVVEDKNRNELIARVLKDRLAAGRRVLLFTDRVEAALYWQEVVNSWGMQGGLLMGGAEHRDEVTQTLRDLKAGTCRFAAATTYADVGLDIPILDCALITCPAAAHEKRIRQQVGRVVRDAPGKRDAEVYYFWDRNIDGMGRRLKMIQKHWKKVRTEEHWLQGIASSGPQRGPGTSPQIIIRRKSPDVLV